MQVHPSIQLEMARQRQRELIAQADRHRALRALKTFVVRGAATNQPTESEEAAMSSTDIRALRTGMRELAHRIDAGVEVTLAWDEGDDSLAVTVSDSRTGECFVLAAEQDNALDVFYHPYAHAVFQTAA